MTNAHFIFNNKDNHFSDLPSLEFDAINGTYFIIYYIDMDCFAYGFIPIDQPKIEDVVIYSCREFHSAIIGMWNEFRIVVKLDVNTWDFCEFVTKISYKHWRSPL